MKSLIVYRKIGRAKNIMQIEIVFKNGQKYKNTWAFDPKTGRISRDDNTYDDKFRPFFKTVRNEISRCYYSGKKQIWPKPKKIPQDAIKNEYRMRKMGVLK